MVRRLPPLNALRAFEAAARLGSFTAAADELNVTPAAISHQVKSLEDYLSVELFVRLPRGLYLTDDGKAYLPDLTAGFDSLAHATDSLHGSHLDGLLAISVLPSFAQCWLMPRLPDFCKRYPQIDLRLESNAENSHFIKDQIDVGIRHGLGRYPGLRSRLIMTEEIYPVASPALLAGAHPLRTWNDLRYHTLLHDYVANDRERWLTWEPWLDINGIHTVDVSRGLQFNNSAMMVDAALAGMGVMLGRTALVGQHVRDGRLMALFDSRRTADFSYYAVCPEATADKPRIRVFVDWLVQTAQNNG